MPQFSETEKTNIDIKMIISSIRKIDELAMSFYARIKVILQWKDARITFKDLTANTTFLSKKWFDQIWLPPLYFHNTKKNIPILKGHPIEVDVLKLGKPKPNKLSELHEGTLFSGEENHLKLVSKNDLTYICIFKLSRFPFDIQVCNVEIRLPAELRKYTVLTPKHLIYEGNLSNE